MKEILRSALVLLVSVGSIHLLYDQLIRPRAEAVIEATQAAGQSASRDWAVILKDWEQEICLVLTVFCVVQILSRMWALASEQYLFGIDMLEEVDERKAEEKEDVEPADKLVDTLDQLEMVSRDIRETQLMETLTASLRRYRITGDVQSTSEVVQTSVEALGMSFEADNAMIRYMIWAIPSIGFVGTVRGIGQALSQADQALAGDIAGMTTSLGTAFNSTLVALLASLLVMLLLHTLQRAQDRRLVDIQAYCEEFLLKRISRPDNR